MSRDLISKATRNEFREILTGFTLREINTFFENANLSPNLGYLPNISGQRRGLVEQYYANIDFTSLVDIKKLAVVYEEIILCLNKFLAMNPYVRGSSPVDEGARINDLIARMQRDGFSFEDGRFILRKAIVSVLRADSLVAISEESIAEHIEKARQKIETGDYAGAITNAYTLVEQFLKEILRKTATPFNKDEGDIRALYKLIAAPLNLSPAGETLESHLKAILEGLKQQIGGLYTLANKMGDRHARRYNPAKHHAKLAVNVAFCLCEFLLDSYEYQEKRRNEKQVS